jgi:hypothetical protein
MARLNLPDALNPVGDGAQDDFTQKMRDELGFIGVKRLPDGS